MAESTVKENRTLEELFQELDGMMRQMEEPGLSLEQSFSLYHRGIELLKSCNDKIDTVEKQIQILEENGECHEFERREKKENRGDRTDPKGVSSYAGRKAAGHHGGDGIQSDGRREKTPSDASLGDLPDVWRCRKDRQTVHGGNRDDPYLFARTR